MALTYVLLSPTFGMHQYTADLANRRAGGEDVALVTTASLPRDRYSPGVRIHTPLTTRGTGFSREGTQARAYRAVLREILALQPPEAPGRLVHFTGVHLWNAPLAYALRRRGVPVVHTLHDLAPHSRVRRAALIRAWNLLIIRSGATLLVHGRCFREQLLREGVPPRRVVYAPLLHGFWSWEMEQRLPAEARGPLPSALEKRDAGGTVIFFGRLEWYKGIDTLLDAWRLLLGSSALGAARAAPRLVLAGRLAPGLALPELPPRVELRNRQIDDAEALALFGAASLLVLPYRDATQTALTGAAARLGVPVLATRTGALPEYVVEGETGWIVPPDNPQALCAALAAALADPDCLRRMGAASQSWFDARRSEEAAILNDLYRSLIS